MVILFITSFLLLAVIVIALKRRHSISSTEQAERALPPTPPRAATLFAHEADDTELAREAALVEAARQRAELLARARAGEREALLAAHESGRQGLYEEVLNILVERAEPSEKALVALVSYLARQDGLRTNRRLTEALMKAWQAAPERGSTAKLLHLSALANDARLYQETVELVLQAWRLGEIPNLTGAELRTLCEGEYWLLESGERSSGAGFLLKRKLAELRRELATTT